MYALVVWLFALFYALYVFYALRVITRDDATPPIKNPAALYPIKTRRSTT